VSVSFPPDIKRAVELLARAEHRSASAEIVKAVEEHVIAAGYLKRPEAYAA
jgi:predicted transcriptional regulator